jgi:clan AA aspartic protease
MVKMIGSVDQRGRPVIRIEGKQDSVLVLVDTGFNGHLMMTRSAAMLLGVGPISKETEVKLADGHVAQVFEARAMIAWLGGERQVHVLVSDDWMTIGDEPAGLLGTDLLAPHLLRIDFDTRIVEIEAQE